MFKKVLAFLSISLILIFSVSCTSTKSVDEQFVGDLSKGLEKRWDIADKHDEQLVEGMTPANLIENSEKAINAELNLLNKYEDKSFDDKDLEELFKQYLSCLNEQLDILDYVEADFITYSEKKQTVDNLRTIILDEINKKYPIKINKKHQHTLDSMLTQASLAREELEKEKVKAEIEEKLNTIVSSIQFNVVEKEENQYSDFREYEATVKNTTGADIEYFSLTVKLKDKEGVVLDTTYCPIGHIWKNDEAVKLSFITDVQFNSIEFEYDYNIN